MTVTPSPDLFVGIALVKGMGRRKYVAFLTPSVIQIVSQGSYLANVVQAPFSALKTLITRTL